MKTIQFIIRYKQEPRIDLEQQSRHQSHTRKRRDHGWAWSSKAANPAERDARGSKTYKVTEG